MFFVRRSFAIASFVSLLGLASCSPGTAPASGGDAKLVVTANVSGSAVATVVVEVAAPDLTTPMVFNIPIVAGVASGSITIPAGSNRTVTIRAFDSGGVLTHTGSSTISVQAGSNPTIAITLTPLSGDVPIYATMGSFTVMVSPTTNTLSLATAPSVSLTATLLDIQGHPATGTVTWATRDPGVAAVSVAGVVSAVGVGQTNIFATFQGAVASAAITVTP